MSSFKFVKQYFSCVVDSLNKMMVYWEDIHIIKGWKLLCNNIIIESHDIEFGTIGELQGNMENHVCKSLKKTNKVNEEVLKSQVNLNNIAKIIKKSSRKRLW